MTVIHTNRFDAQKNRRARHVREYDEGMRELNARYPEQLEATRGPDCIAEDLRFLKFGLFAGLAVCIVATLVKFRAWEFLERTI